MSDCKTMSHESWERESCTFDWFSKHRFSRKRGQSQPRRRRAEGRPAENDNNPPDLYLCARNWTKLNNARRSHATCVWIAYFKKETKNELEVFAPQTRGRDCAAMAWTFLTITRQRYATTRPKVIWDKSFFSKQTVNMNSREGKPGIPKYPFPINHNVVLGCRYCDHIHIVPLLIAISAFSSFTVSGKRFIIKTDREPKRLACQRKLIRI